jgi:hypothetical protein
MIDVGFSPRYGFHRVKDDLFSTFQVDDNNTLQFSVLY